MVYLFEDRSLDTDRRELRRGTDLIDVEPQVFDLVLYLIRHRERVVTKDELISAVWKEGSSRSPRSAAGSLQLATRSAIAGSTSA